MTAVTTEQATEINRIHFNYPYNFSPAPNPETKTTLAEFIRDQEAEYPYAALDLIDKLELDSFGAESFNLHIDANLLATPGYLSAVTVAKMIQYCLLILESEAELMMWQRIDRGVTGRPDAQDIANAIATKVNQYGDRNRIPEYDHVTQLLAAVKHPIVGRGVSNAAINRWGMNEPGGRLAAL
ncbi:MAG: hypothetical protein JO070_10905 [Verrucomicrobia bacterium]|nr:hypothetical protein [Verrucomicrobiota bacterium]